MKNASARIKEICNNGYSLDFGTIFEQSFENYKKIALNAGLVSLILAIFFIAIGLGVFASIYGLASFAETMTNLNPESFKGTSIIIQFSAIVIISAFVAPISAGVLKMAYLADKGEEPTISTAFSYYSSSYMKEILIAVILITSLTTAIDLRH